MAQYSIEVSLYWLLGWGLYRVALQQERFFALNRAYLLLTLLGGLLLPLVAWPSAAVAADWLPRPVIWLQTFTVAANATPDRTTDGWDWQPLLMGAFVVGSLIAAVRFVAPLWALARYIRTSRCEWKSGICWVHGTGAQAPGSWLHFLFWNDALPYTDEQRAMIIAHEQAHIRYRHSWDILGIELLGLLLWWHPLWYAYRHALREVHEYQADAAALRQASPRRYGQLLLQQALSAPLFAQQGTGVVHTFYHSPLKKRIAMMKRQPSHPLAKAKYLLLLPLFAALAAIPFAQAQTSPSKTAALVPEFYEQIDTITVFDPDTFVETVHIAKFDIYTRAEQMPVFGDCPQTDAAERERCSQANLLAFLGANVVYPAEAKAQNQEGTVIIRFMIGADGKVVPYSMQVLDKSVPYPLLSDEAQRVIRLFPPFQPGMQDGKPVNVEMVLPIKFKL